MSGIQDKVEWAQEETNQPEVWMRLTEATGERGQVSVRGDEGAEEERLLELRLGAPRRRM